MSSIKNWRSYIVQGSVRSVNAKKNIAAMFLLKGISIILNLLIVPLSISYVDSYKYGIWLTISSLVTWLSFFDIGFGNGLKNKFIEATSLGKKKLAKIYVSTTYAILSIVIISAWIILSALSYNLDWSRILNVQPNSAIELNIVMIIAISNFCFQFILRLICTLLNALQKPALGSIFDTISQLLVVLILLILIGFSEKGSLINLSIALGISYISVLLIGTVWVFNTILKDYTPSFSYVKFKYAKDLMSLGLKFFFLQIISIVIYQTNNIVISRLLGPSEVTVYNIAFKYMQVLNMLFMIVIAPFWSAFAEAKTLGDFNWMKKVTHRLWNFFLILSICGLILVLISPFVYKIWIGKEIAIPFTITLLMYIFQMLNTWGALHTQLLAGVGKIKLQLIFSTISGIIYIPLIVLLCKLFGLSGILFGNIIVIIMFSSWFGPIQLSKILNRTAKGIWNE